MYNCKVVSKRRVISEIQVCKKIHQPFKTITYYPYKQSVLWKTVVAFGKQPCSCHFMYKAMIFKTYFSLLFSVLYGS